MEHDLWNTFFSRRVNHHFLDFCLEAMAMASSPPAFHRWAFTERLALLASNSLGSEHLAEVVGMGWAVPDGMCKRGRQQHFCKNKKRGQK
jgi:hypothetical protein